MKPSQAERVKQVSKDIGQVRIEVQVYGDAAEVEERAWQISTVLEKMAQEASEKK